MNSDETRARLKPYLGKSKSPGWQGIRPRVRAGDPTDSADDAGRTTAPAPHRARHRRSAPRRDGRARKITSSERAPCARLLATVIGGPR